MKNKITLKLFAITSIFFIIFISATLILQSLFFQKFYLNRKMNNLSKNLEKLKVQYFKSGNLDETLDFIKSFEDNNNAKVGILDSSGQLKLVTTYEDERRDSNKINIIRELIRNWNSNPEALAQIEKSDKAITYIFDNKDYNFKNIVCASKIKLDSGLYEIIFAVSSLQPVNEATGIIKEFYVYIYAAAILIIIVLSFIYSNMISKPLIKLNKTASKMARLDFTEKCTVNSSDEIGSLAATLNFLSENLYNSLKSLKQSNEKLKKDIEKEKQLEKMRKEFVAGVSHELKTPISLIAGYAEALKDDVVQEEEKGYYIDIIMDETTKMANLVKDMLDLSQLESGNFSLNMGEFYLDKLIKACIKKYSNITKEKNINFHIKMGENIEVNGDWSRIEQVVTNFITNAINHTQDNANIFIEVKEINGMALVEIENEGENIREEDINKIWDRFYKIDKSRNRAFGGTGLGLTIVKNILLIHNSDFGVKNTDKGVKFYFLLRMKG